VLYASGHLLKHTVFDLAEIALAAANDYRVAAAAMRDVWAAAGIIRYAWLYAVTKKPPAKGGFS